MIPIKSEKEIQIMAEGGRILARILKTLEEKVKPGIKTEELERAAQALIFKYNAEPAFKGHEGYPACLCTSVNHQIVHAVPSSYQLKSGDILSLDLGIKHKGFYSDMASTLLTGGGQTPLNFDSEIQRLIRVAKKALKLGIKKAKVGNTAGDIGNTIQRYVESQGFGVVRELTGHGIGKELHEEPKILNYGKRNQGEKLKEGMVICIEPMVTMGGYKLKKSADGFGYETKDGSLSAHFEHAVAVTKEGPRVLTD